MSLEEILMDGNEGLGMVGLRFDGRICQATPIETGHLGLHLVQEEKIRWLFQLKCQSNA
jgi:hypothetical protein